MSARETSADLDGLDDMEGLGVAVVRVADDLSMVRLTDEDQVRSIAHGSISFLVYVVDKGAGRIQHLQTPRASRLVK